MVDDLDYVDLGISCAHVCRVLDRETSRGQPDGLSRPVNDAINQLAL